MKSTILLIFGFLLTLSIKGQDYKDIEFSIILGDCFKNDTISMLINGKTIFDSSVITSDFSTGLTGLSTYQDKKKLIVIEKSYKKELNKLEFKKSINISFNIRNKENYSKTLNLKKGKIIVIDYCNRQTETGKIMKLIHAQQYRKNIEFE
jgi:hypothetical protein